MGAGSMETPHKVCIPMLHPSHQTFCDGFTGIQAMYCVVVLSIGRLLEHHKVPIGVCDA